jgi:PKD repeat protein
MPSTPSRTSTVRRILLSVLSLAAALACSLGAQSAYATEGSSQYGAFGQYGEVTRFGGFDSTAYDNGKYDGALTPGKFLNPTGFAVDATDPEGGGTSVFVLDRVSDYPESTKLTQGTEWRLQKLSDTGAVLGSTEFYLPKELVPEAQEAGYKVFVGVTGLAVDDATGRIYTVLYGSTGEEAGATSYAKEVLEWSITPNGAKKLEAPSGSTLDTVSTPVSGYTAPGVLSTASQLAGTTVYDPQGLALSSAAGDESVVIDGDAQKRSNSGSLRGPAIAEQVSATNGAETGSWTAASLTGVKYASTGDATALAAGISSNPDGSLTLLVEPVGGGSGITAVHLPASLTGASIISSEATDPSNSAADPLQLEEDLGEASGRATVQGISLSNGLYAAAYWRSFPTATYWNLSANEGIRLVDPQSEGLLSDPASPPTSIFDTLANTTSGGYCALNDEGAANGDDSASLAAGADGAVWVLTSGADSSNGSGAAYTTGRQVIELAPNAAKPCVGPTGNFSIADATAKTGSQLASTSTPIYVPVDHTVEFNAKTIAYPTAGSAEALVYAYEWDPTGSSAQPVANEYTLVQDDPISGTDPFVDDTESYQYETPGTYTVHLKLLGDFGEYDDAGTVVVQTASPPTATFTAPASAQTGAAVTFDASSSAPATGQQISDYHWSFGDGQTDDKTSSSDTHAYSSAGTYTVTLTVHDNDDRVSTPYSQQITVSSPSKPGPTATNETTTTTTTSTSTGPSTPPPPVIDHSPTNVSPKVLATDGEVELSVSCPATKVSCAGTLEVKTAAAIAVKKGKKKSVLTLGTASFSLTAGGKRTVTIKLSAAGIALLKKDRALTVHLIVAAHDSYGDPLTKTLTVSLREPTPKKAVRKK